MKYLFSILFILFFSNIFSQNWRDTLEFARSAYRAKEYSRSLNLYKSAQKIAPKEFDFSEEIAQTNYKSESFSSAEKIYSKPILGKNGRLKNAQQFHNLGNSRMKQKNYQGAIDSYKKSLRNNSYDNQTRYNLSEAIRKLKQQQNKNNPKSKPQSKSQPQPQPKSQPKSNSQSQNQKSVDRILDKLSKQEAETKRKLGSGNKNEKGQTSSDKDW